MADNDNRQGRAPADADFQPAVPLNDAGVEFDAEADEAPSTEAAKASGVAQSLREGATGLAQQAGDKARSYAEDGKARAGGALDEFSKMMHDAAGTVDEKLGAQYGEYARSAAGQLSGFADTLRNKDVDELIADARDFVRKSPAIAIGTAAAIGFVLARMVKSGLETDNNRA